LLEEAKALYQQRKFFEAIQIAERMVASDADNLQARLLLGDLYMKRGMYQKALDQYREALKLSPNEEAALRGRDLARARMQ
jgi:Flp pilus assembly protein TadD